jgi:hypothetical protein
MLILCHIFLLKTVNFRCSDIVLLELENFQWMSQILVPGMSKEYFTSIAEPYCFEFVWFLLQDFRQLQTFTKNAPLKKEADLTFFYSSDVCRLFRRL